METKVTVFNPIGKLNEISELKRLSVNIQKAVEITGIEINSKIITDELRINI